MCEPSQKLSGPYSDWPLEKHSVPDLKDPVSLNQTSKNDFSVNGYHRLKSTPIVYKGVSTPPTMIRPSVGAWTPSDDEILLAARARGANWAPIQQMHFPTRTANACRKRHERLNGAATRG